MIRRTWPHEGGREGSSTKSLRCHTMEYYTAVKRRNSYFFLTAGMELETIMLSEIRQSMKEKYHMISLISGI